MIYKPEEKSKKIVMLALLTTQALVLSIIESWIPFPGMLPGMKLGLANIIVLTTIVFFSLKETLTLILARTILSSFFTGGFINFLFSISGGVLSGIIMYFLYKKRSQVFGIIGVSIAGASMHNLGQLIIASIIMKETSVIMYLPVLLFSGIVTGSFTGLCSSFLIKALCKFYNTLPPK